MERCTTRGQFCQAIEGIAERFAEELWTIVVETGSAGADAWVRTHGGAWLRRALGVALTARAERLGVSAVCGCGGAMTFRQRRPTRVHTVLPGRDVEATVLYGQCGACQRGSWPVLREIGVDREGFTPALQALATLAAVVEPYEPASTELLGRMAGVGVSTEKMQALVRDEGARATEQLTAAPADPNPACPSAAGPLTVGIDGGMIFVDKRWQEVKLACLYDTADRVGTPTRGTLTRRDVVAVRGTPEALAAQLWPQAAALGAEHRRVIVLGDGAPWIWNLAAELFPRRVEILDWYHADEHISAVAQGLYGKGTAKAIAWRTTQLDRLAADDVDQVLEGLRFLGAHQRTRGKRKAVDDLHRYLTTNRDRMRYQTFRAAGYAIGSGAVESAVSHVVQQRMKRVGMRWRSAGADAMLALRSIYRSTGAWDQFWACRRVA
jgi:Uncharacterised protein family (UPF0236)